MTHPHDLLGGPPPTLLPIDPAAAELADGAPASAVAAAYPASSLVWAVNTWVAPVARAACASKR